MQKRMHNKTEEALIELEKIANQLAEIDYPQCRQLSLALHVLTQATWIEQEERFLSLINPLMIEIIQAAKRHNII